MRRLAALEGVGLTVLLLGGGCSPGEKGVTTVCAPTAGGPYWLEEGEPVEFHVACGTGLATQPGDFQVEPLPPGATWDAATATLRWTPGLDQAAVHLLSLVGPAGEKGWVKVGVADKWSDAANVPVVDPNLYPEEYGLPVLHLRMAGDAKAAGKVPVTVLSRAHTYNAEARVGGELPQDFPKASYTLFFPKEDPFEEPIAGRGLTKKRTLLLVSTFNDNSYLRARLAVEVWRRISYGGIHLQAYSAVVYLNGAYHGLYTVMDRVDEYLVALHKLNRDGNLYRAEEDAANFLLTDEGGQPKPSATAGFAKLQGTPKQGEPGAFDDLEQLVRFVASASPEQFRAEASQRINLHDYEDWWILSNLLLAPGADRRSAYHYRDPLGGTWRYVPWELTGTFGQSSRTASVLPLTPLDEGEHNGMFARLLQEPDRRAALQQRFRTLLQGELSEAQLQGLVTGYAQEVAVSAHRDEKKWAATVRAYPLWANRPDFTTFDAEVEYLQQWIALRWQHLDGVLQGP